MIELAPNHKIGLPLSSPVMIAAGFCGYGDAYRRLIDLSVFGAGVTQPITLRPQKGTSQPRLVETKAGFILNTGHQNPGVKQVLRQYGSIWTKLGAPIIAHLPAARPDDLMRTARALSNASAIAAIELGVPHDSIPQEVVHWLRAIQQGSELPLLVKLPLGAPLEIVEAAVDNYADTLVIGTPPLGSGISPTQDKIITGYLYSPALHALALHDLKTLTDFDVPLVATGGIHSSEDIQAFLKAGASAVQIDSLLFIDPGQANEIATSAIPIGPINY